MVDFSHLYMYSDGFSLIKFFFGDDDKKKDKKDVKKKLDKKKNEKQKESFKKSNTIDSTKKTKNTFNEKQKKLIKKLEIAFDNYLYRKKVKNLIQMQKDNYMIVCSANIPNLYLNIIRSNKKVKQYKLTYDPILKLNVAFLPRKVYRNKKQLKFIFANLKKEIFFEPLYKTENEDGGFINVLDLQEIKEKENNDEENFQNFLKDYYKNKNNIDNKIYKENKDNKDNKDNNVQKIKVNLKENAKKKDKKENNISFFFDNKITIKKKVKSGNHLKVNKKVKKVRTSSSLKMKNNSDISLNSILKERSTQRVKNERKISFGSVQFSY